MNPGSVVSADRAPPPGVLFASSTTTLHPACARTIAALRPFGPEPMTMASIMRMISSHRTETYGTEHRAADIMAYLIQRIAHAVEMPCVPDLYHSRCQRAIASIRCDLP